MKRLYFILVICSIIQGVASGSNAYLNALTIGQLKESSTKSLQTSKISALKKNLDTITNHSLYAADKKENYFTFYNQVIALDSFINSNGNSCNDINLGVFLSGLDTSAVESLISKTDSIINSYNTHKTNCEYTIRLIKNMLKAAQNYFNKYKIKLDSAQITCNNLNIDILNNFKTSIPYNSIVIDDSVFNNNIINKCTAIDSELNTLDSVKKTLLKSIDSWFTIVNIVTSQNISFNIDANNIGSIEKSWKQLQDSLLNTKNSFQLKHNTFKVNNSNKLKEFFITTANSLFTGTLDTNNTYKQAVRFIEKEFDTLIIDTTKVVFKSFYNNIKSIDKFSDFFSLRNVNTIITTYCNYKDTIQILDSLYKASNNIYSKIDSLKIVNQKIVFKESLSQYKDTIDSITYNSLFLTDTSRIKRTIEKYNRLKTIQNSKLTIYNPNIEKLWAELIQHVDSISEQLKSQLLVLDITVKLFSLNNNNSDKDTSALTITFLTDEISISSLPLLVNLKPIFQIKERGSTAATIVVQNSNTQNQFIDALSSFLADRIKQESLLFFYATMKKELNASWLDTLFPTTKQVISSTKNNRFDLVLKNAFEYDFVRLPGNLEEYLHCDTTVTSSEWYQVYTLVYYTYILFQDGKSASEILAFVADRIKKNDTNLSQAIQLAKILSENLQSGMGSSEFISPDEYRELKKNNLYDYYSNLISNEIKKQLPVLSTVRNNNSTLPQLTDIFINSMQNIQRYQQKTDSLLANNPEAGLRFVFMQYKELIDAVLACLEIVTPNPEVSTYIPVICGVNDILTCISDKNYSMALIHLEKIIGRQSNANTKPDSNVTRILSPVQSVLSKWGPLIADIAAAQNSDQIRTVIEAYVLPPGSYSSKRRQHYSFDLATFPGVIFRGGNSKDSAISESIGITVPIGISFTHKTYTIIASFIDFAAPVQFKIRKNETNIPRDISFANLYTPGLHFFRLIKETPFAVGGGVQLSPSINTVPDAEKSHFWQVNLIAALDIPLFTLFFQPDEFGK